MSRKKQSQHPNDPMSVDVLLFGAHPDDVGWGAGGSMLILKAKGSSFGVVDLTRGEMGSRGTSEERDKEAEEAASSVGARFRENLGLPDCGVIDSVKNRKQIARVIRRHRPKLVLAPYWKDRPRPCSDRPSHSEFSRALHAEKVERLESPHKPSVYLYCLLHHFTRPSMVVDISDVYDCALGRSPRVSRLRRI
ncbi:MAG: N-acetylglucosamine malate deacetylase 1 [Acidobacteriaceae bacterium]|jgi:bacillithiol biosynthesis deacetylase BshB1|nr:N-acetylglucosamine malate deacetylase 1 [Acidobacteriaceae bacterium]